MTIDNAVRAKPNVGGLGGNVTTKAAGPGTAPQNVVFEPRSSFSGSDGRTASAAFTSSQDAAVKTVEQVVKRNAAFTPGVPTKPPTCPVTHMVHGNTGDGIDTYHCTSCKWTLDPSLDFCCVSCSNLYHRQCTGSIAFGPIQFHPVDYFGLDICKNCHSRLQNTTPAPFPITRPLSHLPGNEIDDGNSNSKKGSDSDARSTPRSPSSDPDEIPRCPTPDKISIMIEYCSAENENPATDSHLESLFDESNELSIEALFHIRDLVIPLALPRNHPDRRKPLTVVARYFIGNEELEGVGDISGGISDDAESEVDGGGDGNGNGDGIDDAETL